MSKPFIVAIVGRANVGKSTLFNRLCEENKALISPIAGTTRDMNTCFVDWNHKTFHLIDTGGFDVDSKDSIDQEVVKQGKRAMKKADLILFVCSVKDSISTTDREIAKHLRRQNKPIVLVVNKVDNPRLQSLAADFYSLGFEHTYFVSAASGSGTGDLLDHITAHIQEPSDIKEEKGLIKVAILGKPNSGKSSLLNTLLGEYRAIVSPIAHTTRNPNDADIVYKDIRITLVDTAGIRKKSKTKEGLEKLSVMRSLSAIQECDIAILMVEAHKDIEAIDKKIASIISEHHKGIIILGNKWDLIKDKTSNTFTEKVSDIKSQLPWLSFAPVLPISAKTGQHTQQVLDLILQVKDMREKRIEREQLDLIIKKTPLKKPALKRQSTKRLPVVFGMKQVDVNPPTFVIMIRRKDVLAQGYIDRIEKKIRATYFFIGTPIIIQIQRLSST